MNCNYCNTYFEPKWRNQIYCSRNCAGSANNKAVPKRKRQSRALCRYCEKECNRYSSNFCSKECQNSYEYVTFLSKWFKKEISGLSGKTTVSKHIKTYLFHIYDNKCAKCGWNEVNPVTGNIPLEVDHINGDHLDCSPDNLILLCPNCHSLTSTFRGLNANKGLGRGKNMGRSYIGRIY